MTGAVVEVEGPEREVALDMARLGMVVGPGFVALATIFWALPGLVSSAIAFTIVVANLVLGAWIIGRAAAVSPQLLMGAVLGGFALRLLILTAVVVPIKGYGWFEVAPFAITLIGGHLGLLAWETQRVSISLAYPGLPPSKKSNPLSARARSESE
jgi:hypothetical protein